MRENEVPQSQRNPFVSKLPSIAEHAVEAGRQLQDRPKATVAAVVPVDRALQVRLALEGDSLTRGLEELERFARERGASEIAAWAQLELGGYPGEQSPELPSYRRKALAGYFHDVDPPRNTIDYLSLPGGITGLEAHFKDWKEKSPENQFSIYTPATGRDFFPNGPALEVFFRRVRQEAFRRLQGITAVPADAAARPAPDFSVLTASDPKLAELLLARWQEAQSTHRIGAYLSTIILLGSILEGVALWTVEKNATAAVGSKSAPKGKDSSKAKPITEWKLSELLAVVHERGWLSKEVNDFNEAVRDYRNLVHPREQRKRATKPSQQLCNIAFEVVRAAIEELVQKQAH